MVDRYRYQTKLGSTGQAFRDLGQGFGDLFEGMSYGRRLQEEKDKEKRVYDLQRRQLGDVPITQAQMYQMLEGTKVPYGADISDILPPGVEKSPYGDFWKRTPKKAAKQTYVNVPIWVNGKKVPMRLPDDERFNLTIDRLNQTGTVSFEAPKEIITMKDTKNNTITHYGKETAEALKMSDPKRYQTYEELEAKLKPDEVLRNYYNDKGDLIQTKNVDKKQVEAVDKIMSNKGLTPDKPEMTKISWINDKDEYMEEMVPKVQYNDKVALIKGNGGRLKDQAKTSFEMGYDVWKERNPEGTREEYRRDWLIEPGRLSENQVTESLLLMVNYDNEAFSKLYDIYLNRRGDGVKSREDSLNWVSQNVKITEIEDGGGYKITVSEGIVPTTTEESIAKGKYVWGE